MVPEVFIGSMPRGTKLNRTDRNVLAACLFYEYYGFPGVIGLDPVNVVDGLFSNWLTEIKCDVERSTLPANAEGNATPTQEPTSR